MKKLTNLFFTIIAFIVIIPETIGQGNSVEVKVVFPYFEVNEDNVTLTSWSPSATYTMEKLGENTYYTEILNVSDDVHFYISYTIPEFNLDAHVPGGVGGIRYSRVYFDNKLLNNTYTVLNDEGNGLNFSVKVVDENTISPHYTSYYQYSPIDDRIPPEVKHREGYELDFDEFPGDSYHYILGWLQAITDNEILAESEIETDYFKLMGKKNGEWETFVHDDYQDGFDTINHGGLYYRYPFFPEGYDDHDPMPADTQDGKLVFKPSGNRKKVWHWWNSEQYYIEDNLSYDIYKIEAKIRISGPALVQGGIDFRETQSGETYEIGVSDWYTEEDGEWQIVTFEYELGSSVNMDKPANKADINIHYNPSSKIINVVTTPSQGKTKWSVIDINGVAVQSGVKHSKSFNIDASAYSEGAYVIKISSDGQEKVQKIIVM